MCNDFIQRPKNTNFDPPHERNYIGLRTVLNSAYNQASVGKGAIRHNPEDVCFEKQPIMWVEEHFHSFQLGQAVKKIHESQAMDCPRAIAELEGAINFIAAHIIFLKRKVEN